MDAGWWKEEVPQALHPIYSDFKIFLHLAWEHLQLPAPTVTQLDIADALQDEKLDRLIIEAFRGVGKSWVTGAFVCWLGLRDPQIKIEVVSASKDLADQFTTFVLRLIQEMELLQHLYPRAEQRNSKINFDFGPARNAKDPSVKSAGIFGQITGTRADVIIADDIETPNTSETPGMRDKLSERVREFSAIIKPGGRIIFLGTPQTEDSLYNKLGERGYQMLVWPARVPPQSDLSYYRDRLAPRIKKLISAAVPAGTPVDPVRFDVDDLIKREGEYGRSGFGLQFMLNTRLSDHDRYPLKLRELLCLDLDRDLAPEKMMWADDPRQVVPGSEVYMVGMDGDRFVQPWDYGRDPQGNISRREYTGRAMFIDPSGKGRDETAWCVLYMLNSYIFLMDAGGMRDGYGPETLKFLVAKAKEWKVNMVRIEENWGSGMFKALIQPYFINSYPVTVTEERVKGMKEARIVDTLEPIFNTHRLIVNKPLIEADFKSTLGLPVDKHNVYRLFYQMTRMVRERGALVHDDRLDVLAQGCAYWVEQMSVDENRAMLDHANDQTRKAVESFLARAARSRGERFEKSWVGLPTLKPQRSPQSNLGA